MNETTIVIEPTAISAEMDAVASKLDRIAVQREARLKATKGRFNLFTVLLDINDEVRLHTRYLAHLLDPEDYAESHGSQHDCGAAFLEAFLNELGKGVQDHNNKTELLQFLKNINPGKAKVSSEFHTGGKGIIDLLIECEGWAVAIENKIRAAEGYNQIRDYADYLDAKHHGKWVLLYLTLDGKEAKTAYGRPYYRISYKDTILSWLEECSRQTHAFVNINQALQQYSEVVRDLTGMKKEQDMSQIIDVVRKHPRIIKDLKDINVAVEFLKDEMRNALLDKIAKALTELNGQYELRQEAVNANWAIHRCGNLLETKGCNMVLRFGDPHPYLWIAVVRANGKQWPEKATLTNLCNALEAAFPQVLQGVEGNRRVNSNDNFPGGWCYFPDSELSNAGLSDLLGKQVSNPDAISGIAKQIAQDIVTFVQVVDSAWSTEAGGSAREATRKNGPVS
jgi:hypothetical protein